MLKNSRLEMAAIVCFLEVATFLIAATLIRNVCVVFAVRKWRVNGEQ